MTRKVGRPASAAILVMSKVQMYRTVAELSKATGVHPHTVRSVLRRAADRGEIVVKRFLSGKSGRAIVVV
jgi:predicted ArsR family transcriptional regulator